MQIPKITKPMIKEAANATLKGVNSLGGEIRTTVLKNSANIRDKFIKSDIKNNLNKDTVIGLTAIISALSLAGICIKGMIDKISEIRKEK